MSVASTTIAQGAFSDPRVLYLAQIAGYADGVDTAVGKLARLWGRCTHLQADVVSAVEVRACLGPRGDEHLVEAGLGELVPGGVRVKGRYDNATGRDRFAWYAEGDLKKSGRAVGGRNRAANAPRDERGRLLPRAMLLDTSNDTSNTQQGHTPGAELVPMLVTLESSNIQQPALLESPGVQHHQHHQVQEQEHPDRTLSLGSGSTPSGLPGSGAEDRAEHDQAPPPTEPPPGMALAMPRGWKPEPEPDLDRFAVELGVDIEAELVKLRGRGECQLDWQARWRWWLGHAITFARTSRKQAKPSPPNADREARAAAARREAIERSRAEIASLDEAAARDRAEVARLAAEAQTKLRGAG